MTVELCNIELVFIIRTIGQQCYCGYNQNPKRQRNSKIFALLSSKLQSMKAVPNHAS